MTEYWNYRLTWETVFQHPTSYAPGEEQEVLSIEKAAFEDKPFWTTS